MNFRIRRPRQTGSAGVFASESSTPACNLSLTEESLSNPTYEGSRPPANRAGRLSNSNPSAPSPQQSGNLGVVALTLRDLSFGDEGLDPTPAESSAAPTQPVSTIVKDTVQGTQSPTCGRGRPKSFACGDNLEFTKQFCLPKVFEFQCLGEKQWMTLTEIADKCLEITLPTQMPWENQMGLATYERGTPQLAVAQAAAAEYDDPKLAKIGGFFYRLNPSSIRARRRNKGWLGKPLVISGKIKWCMLPPNRATYPCLIYIPDPQKMLSTCQIEEYMLALTPIGSPGSTSLPAKPSASRASRRKLKNHDQSLTKSHLEVSRHQDLISEDDSSTSHLAEIVRTLNGSVSLSMTATPSVVSLETRDESLSSHHGSTSASSARRHFRNLNHRSAAWVAARLEDLTSEGTTDTDSYDDSCDYSSDADSDGESYSTDDSHTHSSDESVHHIHCNRRSR